MSKRYNDFANRSELEKNDSRMKCGEISNFNDRWFHLFGILDAENCLELANDITLINAADDMEEKQNKNFKRKPIFVEINCCGGSFYRMWLLAAVISASKTPVYTYCNSYAVSAAFIIFLSGKKRFMNPNAKLVYLPSEPRNQEEEEATEYENEMMEAYVVERTKLTKEELLDIRGKLTTCFTATQAKELGMIDGII